MLSEDNYDRLTGSLTLCDCFEETARRVPEQHAIEIPPSRRNPTRRTLTYAMLSTRVKTLASALSGLTVEGDEDQSVIAIYLPRSDERFLIAQLAVMRAGSAYVCLDLKAPNERLSFMISDARPRVVITDEEHEYRLQEAWTCRPPSQEQMEPPTPLLLTLEDVEMEHAPSSTLALPHISPRDLAYIIYTSGTTGQPKGVMVEHGQIMTLIRADLEDFDIGSTDRVIQSSSAAYDSSIEETYLAFAFGATLVLADDEVARLGPDLTDWLIEEDATVFCPPPTLLRTLGAQAPQRLPKLRMLYVGGEALTKEVVDAWAPGRQLINGYGPTECAVTITRALISTKDDEISIGFPVRGNRAWLIDVDTGALIEGLGEGELCISGSSVARGYWRRPELTAERFIEHPICGRIYRTGDLVSRRADGTLIYRGRIDTQVKLRGHRVELSEIETHLCALDEIRESVCVVIKGATGAQTLVAFIVCSADETAPETGSMGDDPQRDTFYARVSDRLRRSVPDFMVPARYFTLTRLPTTISGKLDRRGLQERASERFRDRATESLHSALSEPVLGEDSPLALITRAFELHLERWGGVSPNSDFFSLGGDSLRGALVISDLRAHHATQYLAMRDLYEHPTPAGLVSRLESLLSSQRQSDDPMDGATSPRQADFNTQSSSSLRSLWLTSIEALFAVEVLGVGSLFIVLLGIGYLPWVLAKIKAVTILALLFIFWPILGWLWIVPAILLTRVTKMIFIGRYVEEVVPIWGSRYRRHLWVNRIAGTIPWSKVAGTCFHIHVLRALGAKIGRDVYLHKGAQFSGGGWDLITIGDGVTLGRDVSLRPIDFHRGQMICGRIEIGDYAVFSTRSAASPGTSVPPRAVVAPLTCVTSEPPLSSGRMEGHGAEITSSPPPRGDYLRFSLKHMAIYSALGLLQGSLMFGVFIWGAALCSFSNEWAEVSLNALLTLGTASDLWTLLCASFPWLWVLCSLLIFNLLMSAFIVRILPKVSEGSYPIFSTTLTLIRYKDEQIEWANRWLSGTLFWPHWLRLAGVSIGPNSEISTIMDVIPELTTLKGHCFFADGIYLGGPSFDSGVLEVGALTLSEGTFIGNHSVIDGGQSLPTNILLGVCTVAERPRASLEEERRKESVDSTSLSQIRANESWFGRPRLLLPKREVVVYDPSLTHHPSPLRYFNRWMWEISRVFLPIWPIFLALAWIGSIPLCFSVLGITWTEVCALSLSPIMWIKTLCLTSLSAFVLTLILLLSVILSKWILLGKVKEGQHPLWSCWCSRWDWLYVAWGQWAAPIIRPFEGTPLVNSWLRLFGVQIGPRVFIGAGGAQVVDPDMLNFEANTTVANLFQAHSFEDRVLKTAPVYLRARSSARSGSVILYGADIGEDSVITEHSVVMKNEHLISGWRYSGAPSRGTPPPRDTRPLPHPRLTSDE